MGNDAGHGGLYPKIHIVGASDAALVSQRIGETSVFHHFDALGSTLALTDANENVTDTYRYYAFGEVLTSSGTTANPFQFVGQLGYHQVSHLGSRYLLYVRARHYQPCTGRFISVDPEQDGVNWYVYVASRPINSVDPSGLWRKDEVHRDMTKEWAKNVRGERSGVLYRATDAERQAMGDASRQVDIDYNPYNILYSPAYHAPWHFDWPLGSNSRENLFLQWEQKAWAKGKMAGEANCVQSARLLGTALHPIQDIGSHDLASPLEHSILKYNWQYIDEVDYDTKWDTDFRIDIRVLAPLVVVSPIGGGISIAQARKLNYARWCARVFKWIPVGKGALNPRLEETRKITQRRIGEWLVLTRCGERAPK